MIVGREVLSTLLQTWRDDHALLRVECRRRDADVVFEGRIVDVSDTALRFGLRLGAAAFTVSLQAAFEIDYDDVSPAPEHRSEYSRGLLLIYPSSDPTREREVILIAEIVEPQI